MQKITAQQVRSSFINASRSEAAKLNLPSTFDTLDWENLEFLGWRDEKMPQRGYLVVHHQGKLTGVLLRAPEGGSGKRRVVLCELCRDVFSKEDVYLWVAKKAGQSGKEGNTVGTLICAEFGCSTNVRKEPPVNAINPDPAVVVLRQIAGLESRTALFLDRVRGDSKR
ncbi:FBP domain-containing protein [Paenarthrobacter sp. GOM3]|uniref:FBP domain-containing protein n=1 Tax=Paenarthrobacter sp. GOM3 TaxID=2782567 RepID=UPI001BAB91E6|nr:FBP domain-containing protein [Paenarthrobacter sp. GOM3]WOH18359.1 FBP domain-containing protein [Paenarthrobacter sp. GOM3]